MKEFITSNGNIVRIHDGELIKNGMATEKGKAVIGEAMGLFYKRIVRENPGYFDEKRAAV